MTISGKITIDSYEPPRFTQDIDAAVDIPLATKGASMTCIAFDGQYLAADTMAVCGQLHRRIRKIYETPVYFIGMAGEASIIPEWLEWFASGRGERPPVTSDDYVAAIAVDKATRDVMEFGRYGRLSSVLSPSFRTTGSGEDIAIGVLHRGGSAIEAVEAACLHHAYCAAPVEYVDFADIAAGVQVAGSELLRPWPTP